MVGFGLNMLRRGLFPKHCAVEVSVASLQISGYNCYCSNFSHSKRGICLYVKESLIVSELRDLGHDLWISRNLYGNTFPWFCILRVLNRYDL